MNGYQIIEVFRDDITGAAVDRPGMELLLQTLERQPDFEEPMIVIMDDISRWARDVMTHFTLRKAIESRNGIMQSPNFHFGDTPEDRFSETISAAAAEYDRLKNRRQVMQKMKARLERGYWPFDIPPGYRNIKDPVHGKLLAPSEPKASIIREALLGFHSRRFETQTDVANYLLTKEFTHRAKFKGKVHLEQVERLLTRILYAGWIEYPKWNVARRKGHHQELITIQQFDEIQDRLRETSNRPQRKDAHKDFVLRNYLACSECGHLVTASWSKGRNRMYPYYRCTTPHCTKRNKGLRAEQVHESFGEFIERMKPKENALCLVDAVLDDLWAKRMEVVREAEALRLSKIKETDKEIDSLCERLGKIRGEILLRKYESRIEQLEDQKRTLTSQKIDLKDPRFDFGTAKKAAFDFLKEPTRLWRSEKFEDRRTLLKLTVLGVLPYDPQIGFGTARFPLLFELCKIAERDKSKMVEMPGIEPGSNV